MNAAGSIVVLAVGAMPTWWERLSRILTLQDHTTRVVLLGTTLLGVTAGIVGTFMLLRKRALVGDVVGHSALPGIAIAFLVMEAISPGTGKSLPALLGGAFLFGLAGAVSVMLVDRYTRVKSDAAMAMVLSVFYGLGAALFTIVQTVPRGSAAGLHGYLNGKTASLIAEDVWLFAGTAIVILTITLLLRKELTLLCFDDAYAAAEGWPVFWLDTLLIGLVVSVTIIGMQSVGLILVVATLIIPPAAARFWTDDVRWMTFGAGLIGGMSSLLGTVMSTLFPKVAAGAAIVLSGSLLFAISLGFGRKRGVILQWEQRQRLRRDSGRVDLMRAIYEVQEKTSSGQTTSTPEWMTNQTFELAELAAMRTWQLRDVARLANRAASDGLLTREQEGRWRLTNRGAIESRRIARNHRLWEMYLMEYADIAASHVDRDADLIEHVLDPEIVAELEERFAMSTDVPPSSHHIGPSPSS